jgi:hypothetical protein
MKVLSKRVEENTQALQDHIQTLAEVRMLLERDQKRKTSRVKPGPKVKEPPKLTTVDDSLLSEEDKILKNILQVCIVLYVIHRH